MENKASLRIFRLRTLIDHPRTGDAERDVAQRMLDRLLRDTGSTATGDRTYGIRHNRGARHAGLELVAEMIRDEITLARAGVAVGAGPGDLATRDLIRDAPAEIAFSVTFPYDGSLVITLSQVPHVWGWTYVDGIETPSSSMRALADSLANIMNSYNRDGSDIGRRFFGSVRVGDEILVW